MEIDRTKIFKTFKADEKSGKVLWKERSPCDFRRMQDYRSWTTRFSGKEAGSKPKKRHDYSGCIQIHYLGGMLMAHRVMAVLCGILDGYDDKRSIDHIDGDPANNRPENLRAVTLSTNSRNCKKKTKGSLCKITGVNYHRVTGKWQATIGTGNGTKGKSLGYYDDLFEAICARKSAEVKLGYTERHGYSNSI